MESIVYAVDWNQARENVFAGAAWLGGSGGAEVIEQLRKPTALVCSSKGAEKTALAGGRTKRDSMLLDMILNTVEKGGTVLIPTDTSARVLELAYVLEHAWRRETSDSGSVSPLKSAKLYLASRNIGATMRYARSMLEWMDESVVRDFESESTNNSNRHHRRGEKQGHIQTPPQQRSGKPSAPFEFRHMKLLETQKRVEKLMASQGPRVILASDTSLEWGYSKQILERMSPNPNNLVILTEDLGSISTNVEKKSTLRECLWQWYEEGKAHKDGSSAPDRLLYDQASAAGRRLSMAYVQRINLEGKELNIYQQYLATQRQAQNLSHIGKGTALESSADAVDEASSSSSSSDEDSDPERQGKSLNTTAKAARLNKSKVEPSKEALGVNILLRYQGVYDYDVRGKKGRDLMFPLTTKRRRADDFGDLIKPEDYLRAEERDDVDGEDMRDTGSGKQEGLGQKRKWQDIMQPEESRRQGPGRPNKKRQSNKGSSNGVPVNGSDITIHNSLHESDDSSANSESEAEDAVTGPAKLRIKSHSVEAQLKISFLDFSGIHDQRSLSMLIPLIQPKKLILIGGNASETRYLAQDCRQKLRTEQDTDGKAEFVFTPSTGQMVDASVDTNAWTVKLSETLTKRLHWQSVRGLGVATLAGHLAATAPEISTSDDLNSRKKLKLGNELSDDEKPADIATPAEATSTAKLVPILDVLPPTMAAATRSIAQPLHVGDLRLADLRKILLSTGHTADFRGEGTLLIDDLVAVRKSGTGKIEVEGGGLNLPDMRMRTLEDSFYAVKRRIYDGLAIVAGR